ncbi:hypothetical protein F5884DRAFT_110691 [Xylogone sp. PMI_703]|nr:hypothetical protein F5884DRAFT_110691 [Xylogone sp. PMI_703]
MSVRSLSTRPKNDGEIRKVRWKLEIEHHKAALKAGSPVSHEKALGEHTFRSVEQALTVGKSDGLAPWKSGVQSTIFPFLDALQTAAGTFLDTMTPSKTVLYFFLGTLQRTIEITLQRQDTWQSFAQILDNVRQSLERLEGLSKVLNEKSEGRNLLGDTIFTIFQGLLELSVETLSTIRKRPVNNFDNEWIAKREICLKSIEDAISQFSDTVSQIGLRNTSKDLPTQSKPTSSTVNGVTFPLKVLPWPAYKGFFGREEILHELGNKLGLASFDQRGYGDIQSVLVHGTGGVGKTQIARAFAHRNPVGFDAIFWVRSDTEVNIMQDFTKIALNLNLPGARHNAHTGSWFIFSRWLHEQESSPDGKRWLIIYDNCDDIKDIYPNYIPTTKGSILITSRKRSAKLDDSHIVQVEPFDRLDGLKLMKRLLYHGNGGEDKILSGSEEKALQALLEKVDRLPLGIHVMVALMLPRINAKGRHPIRDFSKFYEEHSRQLLIRAPRSTDYDRDVDRRVGEQHVLDNVWHLSFTSLDQKAMSVLGMLSFLAPNDIFISWFDFHSKEIPPTHQVLSVCKDMFEVECAVLDLQGAALISRDNDNSSESDSAESNPIMTPTTDDSDANLDYDSDSNSEQDDPVNPPGIDSTKVSLHRLVQEAVIYSREPEERQAIFDAAIRVMYEAFPRQESGMTIESQADTCSRLMPHILSLVRRHQELGRGTPNPLLPSEEFIRLLRHCIWYLYESGNDTTALQMLDFVYEVVDKVSIDKTSEFYADLQYKAGSVYMDWGFLAKCRRVWEEARKILEVKQAEGSKSAKSQLTWLLMAMGNLETANGNYDAALENFTRSDEERMVEDKDNLWRHGLANMNGGRLQFFMGNYDKAMEKYMECEKGFIPKSNWMACIEYARGNVEYARNNIELARKYYLESVQSWKASGPNHIVLSAVYTKLARLELHQGHPEPALEYIRKAQQIAKGHAHSQGDQARILHTQAAIQEALDRVTESKNTQRLAEEQRLKLQSILGSEASTNFDGTEEAWDSLVCFFWR